MRSLTEKELLQISGSDKGDAAIGAGAAGATMLAGAGGWGGAALGARVGGTAGALLGPTGVAVGAIVGAVGGFFLGAYGYDYAMSMDNSSSGSNPSSCS